MKIHTELATLETYIDNFQELNLEVSKSNVAWHIDHSLKAILGIIKILKDSNPSEYKATFSIPKFFVFNFYFLPRGKAKSPKAVDSDVSTISESSLQKLFKLTKSALDSQLKDINENQFFEHPFFGKLNKKVAIKFMAIHTNHHIKIIKDIIK